MIKEKVIKPKKITDSKLWREIEAKNAHMSDLIKEYNGEIDPRELYIDSPTFDEFARHFDSDELALFYWNELNHVEII